MKKDMKKIISGIMCAVFIVVGLNGFEGAASGTVGETENSKASETTESGVQSSAESSSAEESSKASSEKSTSSEMKDEDKAELDSLNSSLKDLQKIIDELEKEKKSLQSQGKNTQSTMDNLNKQIKAAEKQIDILSDEIERLSGEIVNLNSTVETLKEEIALDKEILKQRIRAIYMNGRTSELEMLLSSESVVDVLTRAEFLKSISDHDNKIINSLLDDKAQLEEKIAKAEELKNQTNAAQNEMENKRKQLDSKYDQSEELLKQIKEDTADANAKLKQYEKEVEEAQKEIEDILKKYVSVGDYIGGDLVWPLPGFTKITSPYGPRKGSTHTGTDIAGRNAKGDLCYGYDIVAANTGKVIAVRDLGGKSYGKYLIIDHGGNTSTLYAHCSKILVSEGDTVSRGQVIAKAGSTGNSTGAHLHFELRMNGVRVNPMDYFKKA